MIRQSPYLKSYEKIADRMVPVAGDDELLHKIGGLYNEIHDTCRQVWSATDGWENPEAYKALREKAKREKAVDLIRKIEELDFSAVESLKAWLDK